MEKQLVDQWNLLREQISVLDNILIIAAAVLFAYVMLLLLTRSRGKGGDKCSKKKQ